MITNKLKLTNSLGVYVKVLPYLILVILSSMNIGADYISILYLLIFTYSIGLFEDRRISDIYLNKDENGFLKKHLILRLFLIPSYLCIKAKELLVINEVLITNYFILYLVLVAYLLWAFTTFKRKSYEKEFVLYQLSTLSLVFIYLISNINDSLTFVCFSLINIICILILNARVRFNWHRQITRVFLLGLPLTPVFIYKLYLLNQSNINQSIPFGFASTGILIIPLVMLYNKESSK